MKTARFFSVMVFCLVFATMPVLAQSSGDGGINIVIPDIDIKVPGVLVTTSASASENAIQITDNHQTSTIECQNQPVTIMGNHNKLTIKGTCTGIQVLGNHNSITIEATPVLSIAGNHNNLTVISVGTVAIMGNYNTTVWSKGIEKDPIISNLGNKNTVNKASE